MTSVEAERGAVAALGDRARGQVERLLAEQPIVGAVLAARMASVRSLAPGTLGGTLFGSYRAGELSAVAFHGGNLLPVADDAGASRSIARHLTDRRRVCTSIVGRADIVEAMWHLLDPSWGPARGIRPRQPVLLLSRGELTRDGHPGVRVMRRADLDTYLPAAAAMFAEELGVSPFAGGTGPAYRRRIEALIAGGRAYGLTDVDGRIAFKADLAVITARTCQVQGVWVRPELRGQGLGTTALAAVFAQALRLAPTVSLYVNDYNAPARAVYERLGMRQVASLSTVLF